MTQIKAQRLCDAEDHPGRHCLQRCFDTVARLVAWVFTGACEQLARWDRSAGCRLARLAINVSMRQLERKDLVRAIPQVLERTGVDASRMELEVTETREMDPDCGSLAN